MQNKSGVMCGARLSKRDVDRLKTAAVEAGTTPAEFIRSVLVGALDGESIIAVVREEARAGAAENAEAVAQVLQRQTKAVGEVLREALGAIQAVSGGAR